MISVCIPIFNIDVRNLVSGLLNQLTDQMEIILIDDCSHETFKLKNRTLEDERITYIELEENIGRSKIRNLFLDYTKNDYLLFLDCDSLLVSSDFLNNYLNSLQGKPKVVCGGRLYPAECPSEYQILRWKYGVLRESKDAKTRTMESNRSFMTNNFLIEKTVLMNNQFDERLSKYGHEDTLLGIELSKKAIDIVHIENPVLNNDVEVGVLFIQKTEQAIDNLLLIEEFYPEKNRLIDYITLLSTAVKIKKLGMKGLLRVCYTIFGAKTKNYLITSKNPSITLFNIYKLMYYFNKMK